MRAVVCCRYFPSGNCEHRRHLDQSASNDLGITEAFSGEARCAGSPRQVFGDGYRWSSAVAADCGAAGAGVMANLSSGAERREPSGMISVTITLLTPAAISWSARDRTSWAATALCAPKPSSEIQAT